MHMEKVIDKILEEVDKLNIEYIHVKECDITEKLGIIILVIADKDYLLTDALNKDYELLILACKRKEVT